MDFKTFTEHMWPFWILGVMVMGTVIGAGHKHLLRVEKQPLVKWIKFLGIITLIRIIMVKFAHFHGVGDGARQITVLPWPVALTVFWEDACHGLPLVILQKLMGPTKGWKSVVQFLLMVAVMIEFGLGHMYQGPMAALFLSFYVPYSMKKGDQYGFGTIMLCHMMYDLVTILFVRYLLGI